MTTLDSAPTFTRLQVQRAAIRNARRSDLGFWVLMIGVVVTAVVLLAFLAFNLPSEDPATSNRQLLAYLPWTIIGVGLFLAGAFMHVTEPHKPAEQPES